MIRHDQDNFVLKHITMNVIKRRRPKNQKNIRKQARAKYFITNREKKMVPVCLGTFLKALNISRFRINKIADRFYYKHERRGGDTTGNRFVAKKESIMTFINSLKSTETHYSLQTEVAGNICLQN